MSSRMDIIEFCRRNDIANKLRAAIEDIENGNGYIVFDGLQDKGALVRVTYNGVNVVLSPGPLLVGFTEIPKVITQLPTKPKINSMYAEREIRGLIPVYINETTESLQNILAITTIEPVQAAIKIILEDRTKRGLFEDITIQTSDALKPDEVAIVAPGEKTTEPPQIIKITGIEEKTPEKTKKKRSST